jgi:hypothetical protein
MLTMSQNEKKIDGIWLTCGISLIIIGVVNFCFTTEVDSELECSRSGDNSSPKCTLVRISTFNRDMTYITSLKGAYKKEIKINARHGYRYQDRVILLTDIGEISISDSTKSANQEIAQITQFINSTKPSLYIKEEHTSDKWFKTLLLGFLGLGMVTVAVINK